MQARPDLVVVGEPSVCTPHSDENRSTVQKYSSTILLCQTYAYKAENLILVITIADAQAVLLELKKME